MFTSRMINNEGFEGITGEKVKALPKPKVQKVTRLTIPIIYAGSKEAEIAAKDKDYTYVAPTATCEQGYYVLTKIYKHRYSDYWNSGTKPKNIKDVIEDFLGEYRDKSIDLETNKNRVIKLFGQYYYDAMSTYTGIAGLYSKNTGN